MLASTEGQIELVHKDGAIITAYAQMIAYNEETKSQFEQCSHVQTRTLGNLAMQEASPTGWQTYNFEVEDLHLYRE